MLTSFFVAALEWRNWQTRETQNLVAGNGRVGSIPSSSTSILLGLRDGGAYSYFPLGVCGVSSGVTWFPCEALDGFLQVRRRKV